MIAWCSEIVLYTDKGTQCCPARALPRGYLCREHHDYRALYSDELYRALPPLWTEPGTRARLRQEKEYAEKGLRLYPVDVGPLVEKILSGVVDGSH